MSAFEVWSHLGSAMAGLMFAWAMFRQYCPPEFKEHVEKFTKKISAYFNPYIRITFPEFVGERLKRSEVYTAIQNYLSTKAAAHARKLRADTVKESGSLVLSMDENEEITDEYQGIKLWWSSVTITPQSSSFSFYPRPSEGTRYFRLKVHKRHRDLITDTYIKHVLSRGKAIVSENRQRKLFTNNPSNNWYGYKASKWSHVVFEHPATFNTLAMDPSKKQEILNDLKKFRNGKEYYARIGKAWKRGYLLFGPPGTGKSTMIAAMANFMNYDVYDLELTTVKDNTELRKLLIDTTSKSIIVIEDIDCSLDLTGQRKKKKENSEDDEEEKDPAKKMKKEEENKDSKVTLSGLLNFIDGLWSACGGERIIVFTTNFEEKLDPALIRRGRMDKHIEMSYCRFEAFKILARNYLVIDSHRLFSRIEELLGEVNMTPADVAENLMPKSDDEDEKVCLENLIQALMNAKEEARKKAEEEAAAKKKAEEEEAKKKAEEEEGKLKNEKKEESSVKEVKENGFH